MPNTDSLQATPHDEREIVLTRVFDVPRGLIFDAWAKPELLERWLGPRGWSLAVCEVDLRVGGAWRFVLRGPGGAELGMSGAYREIAPPERLVFTEAYDGFPGESVVTGLLVEREGTTTLTATVLYPSRTVRDAVLGSGMARGAAESYDKLAEMLASTPDRGS